METLHVNDNDTPDWIIHCVNNKLDKFGIHFSDDCEDHYGYIQYFLKYDIAKLISFTKEDFSMQDQKPTDINTEVRILFSYILGLTESANKNWEAEDLYQMISKIRKKVADLLGIEVEE